MILCGSALHRQNGTCYTLFGPPKETLLSPTTKRPHYCREFQHHNPCPPQLLLLFVKSFTLPPRPQLRWQQQSSALVPTRLRVPYRLPVIGAAQTPPRRPLLLPQPPGHSDHRPSLQIAAAKQHQAVRIRRLGPASKATATAADTRLFVERGFDFGGPHEPQHPLQASIDSGILKIRRCCIETRCELLADESCWW